MASAADFGGDMGLGQLAQGIGAVAVAVDAHQEQQDTFEVNKLIQQERRDGLQLYENQANNSELGDRNFVGNLDTQVADRHAGILAAAQERGLSGKALERLELGLGNIQTSINGRAIDFQSRSVGMKAAQDTDDMVTAGSQTVAMAPEEFETVVSETNEAIDALEGIDPVTRARLKEQSLGSLRLAAGLGLAQQAPDLVVAALTNGVQATELPPVAQNFLGTIASKESAGKYNVRYGGADGPQHFTSYADHPRKAAVITDGPHAGKSSTAAGKYQFVEGTWDRAAKALGLTDFSPASQDRAAWWLAQQDYKSNTGRDLVADLAAGDTDSVRAGLAGTWEAFAKMSDDQFANLVATGGGARMSNGKTGNAILDALPASERLRVLQAAQSKLTKERVKAKSDLTDTQANILTAYENGVAPEQTLGMGDFAAAYPTAEEAQAAYERFEFAREAGEMTLEWRASSSEQILADLEDLKAQADPASDNYASQMKTVEAAQSAAQTIQKARVEDPVQEIHKAFPNIGQAHNMILEFDGDPEEKQQAMGLYVDKLDQAYGVWNTPVSQRKYLSKGLRGTVIDTVNAENIPASQKLGVLAATIFSTDDPDQQAQLFQELVEEDPSIGKMAGVIDAYGRGEDRAAMRLLEAATQDTEKLSLPDGTTNADIKAAFAEELDGGIVDARYGVSAGVMGNGQRIGWDGELMVSAVRSRMLRGEDMDDAVEGAKRDIYGDVEILDRGQVLSTVPAGTDTTAVLRGVQAHMPAVEEQLRGLAVESNDPVFQGMSEAAIGAWLDDGQWVNDGDGGLMFLLPIGGEGKLVPSAPGSDEPLRISLEQFVLAGEADRVQEKATAKTQSDIVEDPAPLAGRDAQLESLRGAARQGLDQ